MSKNLVMLVCASTLLLVGCSKQMNPLTKKHESNLVTLASGAEKTIVDGAIKFKFLNPSLTSNLGLSPASIKGKKFLAAVPNKGKFQDKLEDLIGEEPKSPEATPEAPAAEKAPSLLVAIPIGLLGEQNLFGGVITKVSDKNNSELGSLKLTDLTPMHVRPLIAGISQGKPSMVLAGCVQDCNEDSAPEGLIAFPIVGVLEQEKMIVVDLSAVGEELDLITMMDPQGEYTGLRAVSSSTTAMDYSFSTLVFDVTTKFVPRTKIKMGEIEIEIPAPKDAPVTEFVVRWYLKLNSASDPSFSPRAPTEGVGYFTTQRSEETKITRFSKSGVRYYLKNIPEEHRKAFSAALDSWNSKFEAVIGSKLIDYKFVEKTDELYAELVPGDIRYNIIEWDLENKAGYGGLGPSIANQYTGETLSANILIQGPTIIQLYSEWFKTAKEAEALRAEGDSQAAHDLLIAFNKKAETEVAKRKQRKFSVKLGKLSFNMNAQKPELEDPIMKGAFDLIPEGQTYETYMAGYFHEMLAHEMGHNLGLRHNFRGNLGDDGSRTEGSTSRSIMEYLGRGYRYINRISHYDVMAIQYGYKGIKPTHLDWFCTDEDGASDESELKTASAECSKDDATSDPFSYFEGMLKRTTDLVIAPKSAAAPLWKTEELKAKIETAVKGLSHYALSAEATAKNWTNFFGKEGRPADAAGVKDYVIKQVKEQICNKALVEAVNAKESEEARTLANANLESFTKIITAGLIKANAADEQSLKCE